MYLLKGFRHASAGVEPTATSELPFGDSCVWFALLSAHLKMHGAEFASGWKSPAGREQKDEPFSKESHCPENHDLCGTFALPEAHVQRFNEGQVFPRQMMLSGLLPGKCV